MHATNQLSYEAILTLFFQQTFFIESALLQITASSVPARYITFWSTFTYTKNNTSIGESSKVYVYRIWCSTDCLKCIYIYIFTVIWCTNSSTSITYHLPSNNQHSIRLSPWVSPTAAANFYDFAWPTGYARWSYTKTTSTGDRNQWGRHVWISSWGYGGRKLSILSWCIFLDGYGAWSRNSST